METMNDASAESASEKALSATQTYCLRRFDGNDAGQECYAHARRRHNGGHEEDRLMGASGLAQQR